MAPRPGFDQKEIARQFTKISWEARTPERLPLMRRRAFKTAATEPGGPVYLAMAHYALEAKGVKAQILPESRFMIRTPARPGAAAVEEAAKMLVEAKRPLIVAGDEVWKSGAQAELLALSEKLGLPVADSATGYRNFPTLHPHYMGPFSMGSALVKRGVDLILCIGSRDFGRRGRRQSQDFRAESDASGGGRRGDGEDSRQGRHRRQREPYGRIRIIPVRIPRERADVGGQHRQWPGLGNRRGDRRQAGRSGP